MRRAIIAQAALLVSALLWAGFLATSSPLEGGSGSMAAVTLVALAAIAVVGTMVAGGRWARRLGLGVAAATLAISPVVDGMPALWIVAVALSAYSLAESAGTGLTAVVRRLPSASGPPVEALMIPLVAVGWPATLALAQPTGVDIWDWTAALAMIAAGFWYARALPGALWVARLGVPLLGLLSAAFVPFPEWLLPAVGAGGVAVLAWSRNARVAVQPLVERGRPVPIPPELAPSEVLDAAGLDDRGRRRS